MKRLLCIICLMVLANGCATVTLKDVYQHIDDYYQTHPEWSYKELAVKRGETTTLMTLTEIRLATSVRKVKEVGSSLASFSFDDNGRWIGDTSARAGGFLWWTVERRQSYGGRYGRTIDILECTYYFKWDDALSEYLCYDWIRW